MTPGDGHAHGAANPHYWLDTANAETITAVIAEGIARLRPALRGAVGARRDAFLARLRASLAGWETTLAPFGGAAVIAYHNSWPYFARRFRLNIIAVIEPKEGVAPSPARLVELLTLARKAGTVAILHDAYQPSDVSALIAERARLPLVVLAPSVGSLPDVQDYTALFDYDVSALARALPRDR